MISVVIPTFNEEESIPKLIQFLKDCDHSDQLEIIISDGASTDKTADIAESLGVRIFVSPKKGRAAQMNFGAKKAMHKILYFLHADTIPPKSFVDDILNSLDSTTEAGCFRLIFNLEHPALKLYAWFTKFKSTFFRFGDQSLFITRKVFEEVKGFDEDLLVMEDQKIIWSIKKRTKFIVHTNTVITSSRKYLDVGIFKLQLVFSAIFFMYYFGVPQNRLVKFYKNNIG